MHLRREREALDGVEEKEVVWRFICKFCRHRTDRTFWADRCTEVLQILMLSDTWKAALLE